MGSRENERARGTHACLPLARPFFLAPATQVKAEDNTLFYICGHLLFLRLVKYSMF